MSLIVLEGAAVVVTLLAAMEMHRQQFSWRFVLTSSVIMVTTLTVMILSWRGR